jgi:hypothetical protein
LNSRQQTRGCATRTLLHLLIATLGFVVASWDTVSANCYNFVNNTNFPQAGRLIYSAPIGQGPVSFVIAPHSHYLDCFNAPGYRASVFLNNGAFWLYHDGRRWTYPLVFGDDQLSSPAGDYFMNPPPSSNPKSQN